MVIAIGNLPSDSTEDEIKQLLPHVVVISVRTFMSSSPDKQGAWMTLDVQNRNWLNKLARGLDGRVHRGHVLEATAFLFFSH